MPPDNLKIIGRHSFLPTGKGGAIILSNGIERNLNYNSNTVDAIIQMRNDEYYGSDIAKIQQVIDMLFNQGYLTVKCADFIRPADLVNDFDNVNWETAYEDWQP